VGFRKRAAGTRGCARRDARRRSSGQLAQSRKAAKSSAEARALRTSRPLASARNAQPRPASPHTSETPQTSLRLCASARDNPRRTHHCPLEETIADTPRQLAQSRRAAERSPQAWASGHLRPASPHTSETPQTSWRLGVLARHQHRRDDHHRLDEPIEPTPPDSSRKAAKPQRPRLSRPRRGLPDRWHRSGTPTAPSRRAPRTPQTSLRLCASARDNPRRTHRRPLEEPTVQPSP
jgi:hypothetical protein